MFKIRKFLIILQVKPKFVFLWMVVCVVGLIFSSLLFISAIVLAIFIEFDSEILWTLFAEPINIGKACTRSQPVQRLIARLGLQLEI
jgi:hypothetical protein